MKKLYSLLIMFSVLSTAYGQAVTRTIFYDKCYYNDNSFEIRDVSFVFRRLMANTRNLTGLLVIKNLSKEVLVLNMRDIVIDVKGSYFRPEEQYLLLKPGADQEVEFLIQGNAFRTEIINILIQKVGFAGSSVDGVYSNYDVSKFKIQETKIDKSVDNAGLYKVVASMKVTYNGNDIGFYNKGNIKLKTPSGNLISNKQEDSKKQMLRPEKSDEFTIVWSEIDKSEGNLITDASSLVYNECFIESKINYVTNFPVPIVLNEVLSKQRYKEK